MNSAGGDLHYPGKEDRGSILNFDKIPVPILQKPSLLLVPQIHALGGTQSNANTTASPFNFNRSNH